MGVLRETAPARPADTAEGDRGRRAPGSLQLLILIWSVLTLCCAVPLLGWAATYSSQAVLPGWWTAWVVIVWAGVHLAWLIARGIPRLPEFSLWIFVYLFMGFSPLLQTRTSQWPTTTPGVPIPFVYTAGWIMLISLAGIELGMWLARRHAASRPLTLNGISQRRATILAYVGIVLCLYYVQKIGLAALFSTRLEINLRRNLLWPDETTQAIINVCAYVPLLVATHAIVRARRHAREVGEPAKGKWLAVGCLVLLFIVVNPVTSPRYVFGTMLFSLVFLAGGFQTRTRTRAMFILITAALVFVFPYADVFRTADGGGRNQSGLVKNLTINGDYDAYAQLVSTVGYVDTFGDTNGRQALGVALFWVPRSVWPDKPTDTGILLAEASEYGFKNLSAPLWSEMFINWSWPAVVLGSIALGFGVTRLSERLGESAGGNTAAAVGLGVVSFYMLIVLRGSLLQSMANLTVLVACTFFIRQRSSAEPGRLA